MTRKEIVAVRLLTMTGTISCTSSHSALLFQYERRPESTKYPMELECINRRSNKQINRKRNDGKARENKETGEVPTGATCDHTSSGPSSRSRPSIAAIGRCPCVLRSPLPGLPPPWHALLPATTRREGI